MSNACQSAPEPRRGPAIVLRNLEEKQGGKLVTGKHKKSKRGGSPPKIEILNPGDTRSRSSHSSKRCRTLNKEPVDKSTEIVDLDLDDDWYFQDDEFAVPEPEAKMVSAKVVFLRDNLS